MKPRAYIITLFIALSICGNGQEIIVETEQQLENLTELLEEDVEDESFLQQLTYLKKHPININKAASDDLRTLRVLTDLQIENLIIYRSFFGTLIDLYELQAVPTWDIITIRKILPFITVADNVNVKNETLNRLKDGEHYILLRSSIILQDQKGFDKSLPTHYAGGKERLLLRYKYQFKNLLQYGVTADKDAGEDFFKGAQSKGFDFYSFHFFARQLGRIKALALGDFTVNMGQGLIHWQSLAFKKGADAINIKRQSSVLLPYTSAGEFNFHRGGGATLKLGPLEGSAFVSIKNISANSVIDTVSNEEAFSSIFTSGLHRTAAEIADRHNIGQTTFGGNLTYKRTGFSMGLNGVHYQFSKSFQKRDEPYNKFAITGKSWSNYSFDYSFTHRNFHLFGEAATDKQFNNAFLSGALIAIDPKADVTLLYRNIEKNYASLYSNAFTEGVYPVNEKGFYSGISIRPTPQWRIDGYADIYQFPWIRYRVDAPSGGKDYLLQLTYKPVRGIELYTRFKSETKGINAAPDSVIHYINNIPRLNWRLHLNYQLSREWLLKARTDIVWYDKKGNLAESGFLTYIEGTYKPSFTLSLNLRLQYFETDGFNSRIYAYESDVLHSYSIPPFFDKGFRYYFNLNYDVSKKLSIWGRWAQTIYRDKESIGSGLDEIKGNKRSEIKLQLRYIF